MTSPPRAVRTPSKVGYWRLAAAQAARRRAAALAARGPEGHRLPRALATLTAGLEALRGGRGTRAGGGAPQAGVPVRSPRALLRALQAIREVMVIEPGPPAGGRACAVSWRSCRQIEPLTRRFSLLPNPS